MLVGSGVQILVCSRRSHLIHCCAFADAFADAETDDNNSKDYVHIRIQQRNGKKSLTTVQVIFCTLPRYRFLSQLHFACWVPTN